MGAYFQALFGIWVVAATSSFSSFSVYCIASFYTSETTTAVTVGWDDPPAYKSTYSRYKEIEKECSPVLAEASELHPEQNRLYMIEQDLSFVNGDWMQHKGSAPLLPFTTIGSNYTTIGSNYTVPGNYSPINLVSFWITDVDQKKVSGKMVNVSGILKLAISTSRGIRRRRERKDFRIRPGFTSLTIQLEGVYFEESKNSKEERVLCMLGSTHLPSRGKSAVDPWDWLNKSELQSPTLLADDRILLQLRYPSKLSLTSREIRGTLRSLNRHSSSIYFDEIDISSQLATYSNYEFDSDSLVAKACAPHQYPDKFQSKGIEVYRGKQFCSTVKQLMDGQILDVVPSWNCSGTDAYCNKLGPFIMDNKLHEPKGGFDNIKLCVQRLMCTELSNSSIANVSAVFRAVPSSQDQYLACERTGLNGLTLTAEGKWNSSSGQLCMVGCLGSIKNSGACNSRICMYIPLSLSLKQRSVIAGSIEKTTNPFYPLSFELIHHRYLPRDVVNNMSYEYNKTRLAQMEKNVSGGFGKSFLKYPQKKLGRTRQKFSDLGKDLSVHSQGIFDLLSRGNFVRSFIDLDVIAIEEFVGVGWDNGSNFSLISEEVPESPHSKGPEQEKYLKVAAQLKMEGKLSNLFLEGLYYPRVGKMHLIGCRDVRRNFRAPWWRVLHETGDLQDGFDCLIEVKVEYPPTNARWFRNPTVKLSVKSQRAVDDRLFFKQIKIETLPILYWCQTEEIFSRKTVEGGLRILTLSMMIGCIVSQLFYSREKTEVSPYISLVMLGLQAIGYSIPLITGADALFESTKSEAQDNYIFYSIQSQGSDKIEYMVKLLLFIACLLTLRLCQKVWKSRIRLLTRSTSDPWRVPSDKRVLSISSAIHAMGFLIVLIVHNMKTSSRPIQYSARHVHNQVDWETELQEYVGLVQDFFLLPQIIGNILWHFEGKPLRKLYYIGITVLRLLPHIYDYFRPPVFNPYYTDGYEYASRVFKSSFANPASDFYSKFGDISIPVTAMVLAIVIFIQQRWNKHALSQALRLISSKISVPGSRMYEMLPSKTFESELVSGSTERSHVQSTAEDE